MRQELPTPTLFDEVSSYWAEIAEADATEKQVAFVKSHVKAEGLVLDLACGSGRHAVSLCEAGYEIVGLDVSSRLLKIARAKSAKGSAGLALVRADMRFLPFRSAVFLAVLSLDSSFGYLPSETEDLKSFTCAAIGLSENGVFLVDVFNRDRILKRYGKRAFFAFFRFGLVKRFPSFAGLIKWREYPSFWLLQKRSANAETGLLRDFWVFRDKKTGKISVAKHVIRLYTFSQLHTLLKNAGFGCFKAYGNYEGQVYKTDSNRLILVSRKT